jgi:hypothetical protein
MQEVLYLTSTGNFYFWILLPAREVYFLGLTFTALLVCNGHCTFLYFSLFEENNANKHNIIDTLCPRLKR